MAVESEPCVECGSRANRFPKLKGKCTDCGGTGIDIAVAVVGGYEGDCEKCGGTGICPACDGSGVRPANDGAGEVCEI